MASLPDQIRDRLAQEFRLAASKVAEAEELEPKLYYFSVFYGETGRMLNLHWNADLALLFEVVQTACQQIGNRARVPAGGGIPVAGIPDGFLAALDQVSQELAESFQGQEIDLPRLYAALGRTAELTYATTGNGLYLHLKGMIKL
jgi:hypothetical protein